MRGPTAILVGLTTLLAVPAVAACAVDPYQFSPYPESLVQDQSGAKPSRAWYDDSSTIYDHFVLGRYHEPTLLYLQPAIRDETLCGSAMMAGDGHVFEDIAPRLADLTGDGWNEVIVVRSNVTSGAQLAVYSVVDGRIPMIAATAPLGRHRWLAPAGIADFDGDGRIEIAYVDRPHLRKDLVFVRLDGDRLVETLRLPGLTNHRIGDDFISGGVRDCGQGPELVLASADWSRLMRVRGGVAEDIGPMPAGGLTVPPC
ncbi:MAG: FG-GAP repeat domain-containing protein [Paracoccaceae bacterium]